MEQIKENSTLLDMVQGAVNEIINDNVADILMNIKDPNTDLKARELVIKVKLTPNGEQRKVIGVEYNTNKKVRPIKPIITAISVANDENGQLTAIELLSESPGQMLIAGGEVPQPKIISFNRKEA